MPRLTLMLAVAALVGGCGSSSSKESVPKANTAQQVQQDAVAKSDVRVAVTEIEACFVDQAAYTGCKPSKPSIKATTTDTGYVVTAASESGNSFVMTKDASGALKRTCTTAGDGGCPASGAW